MNTHNNNPTHKNQHTQGESITDHNDHNDAGLSPLQRAALAIGYNVALDTLDKQQNKPDQYRGMYPINPQTIGTTSGQSKQDLQAKQAKELKIITTLRNYFSHYYYKIDALQQMDGDINQLYRDIINKINYKANKQTAPDNQFTTELNKLHDLLFFQADNEINIKVALLIISPYVTRSLMAVLLGKTLNRLPDSDLSDEEFTDQQTEKSINNQLFRLLSRREKHSNIASSTSEAFALGLLNQLHHDTDKFNDELDQIRGDRDDSWQPNPDDWKNAFATRKQGYSPAYNLRMLIKYLNFYVQGCDNTKPYPLPKDRDFKVGYYNVDNLDTTQKFTYAKLQQGRAESTDQNNSPALEYISLAHKVNDNQRLFIKYNNIYVRYTIKGQLHRQKWSLIHVQTMALFCLIFENNKKDQKKNEQKKSAIIEFLNKVNDLDFQPKIRKINKGSNPAEFLQNFKDHYLQCQNSKHQKALYCLNWLAKLRYVGKYRQDQYQQLLQTLTAPRFDIGQIQQLSDITSQGEPAISISCLSKYSIYPKSRNLAPQRHEVFFGQRQDISHLFQPDVTTLDQFFDKMVKLCHILIDDILDTYADNDDKLLQFAQLVSNRLPNRPPVDDALQTMQDNGQWSPSKRDFITLILGEQSTIGKCPLSSTLINNDDLITRSYEHKNRPDKLHLNKVERADSIIYNIARHLLIGKHTDLIQKPEKLYETPVLIPCHGYKIKITVRHLHRLSSLVHKYHDDNKKNSYLKQVVQICGAKLANQNKVIEYDALRDEIAQIEKNRWNLMQPLLQFEQNQTISDDMYQNGYIQFDRLSNDDNLKDLRNAVMHMDAVTKNGLSLADVDNYPDQIKDLYQDIVDAKDKKAQEYQSIALKSQKKSKKKVRKKQR